jgi:hypothetical protein
VSRAATSIYERLGTSPSPAYVIPEATRLTWKTDWRRRATHLAERPLGQTPIRLDAPATQRAASSDRLIAVATAIWPALTSRLCQDATLRKLYRTRSELLTKRMKNITGGSRFFVLITSGSSLAS